MRTGHNEIWCTIKICNELIDKARYSQVSWCDLVLSFAFFPGAFFSLPVFLYLWLAFLVSPYGSSLRKVAKEVFSPYSYQIVQLIAWSATLGSASHQASKPAISEEEDYTHRQHCTDRKEICQDVTQQLTVDTLYERSL
jgi:hypothetical protein